MALSAEQAAEAARKFIASQGHSGSWVKLDSATYDEKSAKWTVTFDVGILIVKLMRVTVDANTGQIRGAERVGES